MRVLKVAIVGAGPAGLYTAEALLQREHAPIELDLIDRLPTPYGLVRYGVAPDHPSIKSVVSSLSTIVEHPFVRFFGDVNVGVDVTRAELRQSYDAVVYAIGAPADRRLQIPGEDLQGSFSATELVAWYNGHPDAIDRYAMDATDVVIVGAGNVALDIARILARPHGDLARTDMPSSVLSCLAVNAARHVHVLARRGPEHTKFSTKELREFAGVSDLRIAINAEDLSGLGVGVVDRRAAANMKLFDEWACNPTPSSAERTVEFHFSTAPIELLGSGCVEAVRIERTAIDPTTGATVGTGEFATLPAQMVVRAIGYRGLGIPGLPVSDRGVIPNVDGRVDTADDGPGAREYVAGWIKRGPTGVIGTNKADAKDTVQGLLEDLDSGRLSIGDLPHRSTLEELLTARRMRAVSLAGWRAIDAAEIRLGQQQDRDRAKITDWATFRQLTLASDTTTQTGYEE